LFGLSALLLFDAMRAKVSFLLDKPFKALLLFALWNGCVPRVRRVPV
jgi:hypothetical protein